MVDEVRRRVAAQRDRLVAERINRLGDESADAFGLLHRAVADAFASLYRPRDLGSLPPAEVEAVIVEQFQRLYYHLDEQTWRNTRYRGIEIQKCPLDMWIYQEILHELRPQLVIETGTAYGGSAYFLADLCSLLGVGRVVTIDIEPVPGRPSHERLTYLLGSSTDPDIVSEVAAMLPGPGPVLVILDSDHSLEHVRDELDCYSGMVTDGSYLIVEDTNVHGHPVLPDHPPGPMEAVHEFLANHREFTIDRTREKFMATFNPSGYLRRLPGSPSHGIEGNLHLDGG